MDRQIATVKRKQDSLQRQIDTKKGHLTEICDSQDKEVSFCDDTTTQYQQAELNNPQIKQVSSDSEIEKQAKIQIDRAQNLREKCAQSQTNLEKLKKLRDQIVEEIGMTTEDREGQSLVQADFVARRENLDLMLFEQSKNIYGKEFSIFLQLENEPQNRELSSEYTLLKSLSFVEDIIQQLEQIKEEQDIEKHQKKNFGQKALMIR